MESNNNKKMPKAGQAGNGTKPHVSGSFPSDGVSILIKALKDIKNWGEDMEDEWGDPGYRAMSALKDYNAGRRK